MKSLSIAIIGAAFLYFMSTIKGSVKSWDVLLLIALIFFILIANNN
jgi:hypothetical protein